MDKQATIGFVLIGIVLVVWMWLAAPQAPPPRPAASTDTTHTAEVKPETLKQSREPAAPEASAVHTGSDSLGQFFAHLATGEERVLTIKTDLYTAQISTKGGLIRKWELTKYLTWDKHPVHIVDYDKGGDFSLLFTSTDGRLVNTRNLYFTSDFPAWKTVELKGDETFSVDLRLPIGGAREIVKRLTFSNGTYSFDADLTFRNVSEVIANFEYQVIWEHGVRFAEHNSVEESNFAKAYAYSGGELTEVDASHVGEAAMKDISGSTAWVAARSKYFAVAMLPEDSKSQGAYVQGIRLAQPDHGVLELYSLALKMPLRGAAIETARISVFLGPLDFDVVKAFNKSLDQIMSLGWAWVIRPISEYVMLPLFSFLRWLIPNYGLVIIIFSIIIKVVLHPLTKTSMKSMKQMQQLQPLMAEIREKYKDDQQKMNHQIMNLYKEYGVNPAAGCLPMLLQMPILFALYSVFSSSIDLRQAGFVWWIQDLSIPDTIFTLPFTLPLFGIKNVSGLALAMGITMFVQQKMTVTDPRQKAMVWMMPVMMTLLFNSFPSGLNLYYFVFNLLSIIQQTYVNKAHGNEPLKKVDPKKRSGGIMGRLTKDLPKMK